MSFFSPRSVYIHIPFAKYNHVYSWNIFMNDFAYADIILLAFIAGFVLLRLRSVLGQKHDEDEHMPSSKFPQELKEDTVVQLPGREEITDDEEVIDTEEITAMEALESDALREIIEDIKEKDSEFSVKQFLDGAKGAFEMVFDAFAEADKRTIKQLVSKELYPVFEEEIDKQAESKQSPPTLVSVLDQQLVEAHLDKSIARISVKFTTEQMTVENAEDEENKRSVMENVTDIWEFERNLNARSPNWTIIET